MKIRAPSLLLVTMLVSCVTAPALPQADAAWTAERYVASVWNLPAEAGPASRLSMQASEIERLRVQMQNRYEVLQPEFDGGVVGLTADGFVAIRDPDNVPFDDRARLRELVANENADRSALYRQIAVSNGEPAWQSPLREVFAQRWIARAVAGWWIEDASGDWQQK